MIIITWLRYQITIFLLHTNCNTKFEEYENYFREEYLIGINNRSDYINHS